MTSSPISVARTITAVAIKLQRQMREKPGNYLLSPFLVAQSLALLAHRARPETKATICDLLGTDPSREDFGRGLKDFRGILRPTIHQPIHAGGLAQEDFNLSQRLWLQTGFPINPDLSNLAITSLGIARSEINFDGLSEIPRSKIGTWLDDCLPKGSVSLADLGIAPHTRFLFASLLHFASPLAGEFHKSPDCLMTMRSGKSLAFDYLLGQRGGYRLIRSNDFDIIEIPFQDHRFSMMAWVPHHHDGLAQLEDRISESLESLSCALENEHPEPLDIYLPPLEFSNSKSVQEIFGFPEPTSDEYNITALSLARASLPGSVSYSSHFKLDASTTGSFSREPPLSIVALDRPFWFSIRFRPLKTFLLIGRIAGSR